MKNRVKNTLRPEKLNLGISSVLFLISGVIPNPIFASSGFFSYGIPLPVYRLSGVMDSLPQQPVYEFWIIGIAVNIVLWYIIGSVIAFYYRNRVKEND